ncbi:MAG: 4-hydroxy-3-methylbut-2-enyl diphosphate reductase [Clostridia bacterium]|nr:4-hydroxy-3-methylbut-2-enyl diphosphate reductase [Clostridia bacterium]
MEIILSKYYGPCFGVSSAFEEAINTKSNIKILGEIAHNKILINKLKSKKNIKIINNISEISKDEKIIIRTHGIKIEDFNNLLSKNINIIDKTCPKVRLVQKIAENAEKENKFFVLIGNANHPEVIGVASRCKNTFIINNEISAKNLFSNIKLECNNFIVAAQTTFDTQEFEKICQIIKKINFNTKIYNTICNDSLNRRQELELISNFVDLLIILGSNTSSNAKNLFKTAQNFSKNSVFLENPEDFNLNILENKKRIFITSAASVLKETVLEFLNKINNYFYNLNKKINLTQII